MRNLVFRSVARREFDDAADWYDNERLGLGRAFIDEVETTIRDIRQTPERFAKVESEIREALVKRFPYAIYFSVESNSVLVLAVIHTARDPDIWKRRR